MKFLTRLFPFASILLAGCTTLHLPSASTHFTKIPWSERKTKLQTINRWNIAGAFSVQYNQKTHIASYTWQQLAKNYQIEIHSSLNLYSVRISGRPGAVTLYEASKKTQHADSAEALLQQRLGWNLPISNLSYWVRGLPAPGKSDKQFDKFGHLSQIHQNGWQVRLSHYANYGRNDLPRTLDITGKGLKVRVAIKSR